MSRLSCLGFFITTPFSRQSQLLHEQQLPIEKVCFDKILLYTPYFLMSGYLLQNDAKKENVDANETGESLPRSSRR